MPWLKLRRNTSAPARNSRSTISGADEAGPSVATTLVRRRRRSGMWVGIENSFSSDAGPSASGAPAGRPRPPAGSGDEDSAKVVDAVAAEQAVHLARGGTHSVPPFYAAQMPAPRAAWCP